MTLEVLVLGSSGFVGSRIVDRLYSEPDVEVVTSSRSSGNYRVDITDEKQIDLLPDDVDVVVNAAGAGDLNGLWEDKPEWDEVNLRGIENLAGKYSDTRFIHISSLSAMGLEGDYLKDQEPEPKLPYSCSKLESEKKVRSLFEDPVIVRPGLVYDERMKPGMLWFFSLFGLIPTNHRKTVAIESDELAEIVVDVLEESSEDTVLAGNTFQPEELASENGLKGRKVFLPNYGVLALGAVGEIFRKMGFRVLGMVRARSIVSDPEIDNYSVD